VRGIPLAVDRRDLAAAAGGLQLESASLVNTTEHWLPFDGFDECKVVRHVAAVPALCWHADWAPIPALPDATLF
jgi:hypothetical protein